MTNKETTTWITATKLLQGSNRIEKFSFDFLSFFFLLFFFSSWVCFHSLYQFCKTLTRVLHICVEVHVDEEYCNLASHALSVFPLKLIACLNRKLNAHGRTCFEFNIQRIIWYTCTPSRSRRQPSVALKVGYLMRNSINISWEISTSSCLPTVWCYGNYAVLVSCNHCIRRRTCDYIIITCMPSLTRTGSTLVLLPEWGEGWRGKYQDGE